MAIAFVRGGQGEGSSVTTVAFTSNNAGDLLVVAVWSGLGGSHSISDSNTNSWTQIGTVTDGVGSILSVYYCENCKASAGTNTITLDGGNGYKRLMCVEYSGIQTSTSLRTSLTNFGSGTTATVGNMTVVVGDLVLGSIVGDWSNDNWGAGSGYTKRAGGTRSGIEEKIAASTTENPSASGSGAAAWTAIGAAFKEAVAATKAPPPFRTIWPMLLNQ
jgi:hypothetical protein